MGQSCWWIFAIFPSLRTMADGVNQNQREVNNFPKSERSKYRVCATNTMNAFSTVAFLLVLSDAFAPSNLQSKERWELRSSESSEFSRRQILQTTGAAFVASFLLPANAVTGALDGNLPDLPPEASRSYLQYRIGIQTSADYYLWELQDQVASIDDWGEIGQLFQNSGARGGQGQPSRIERQFVNPMRILGLSMPPDIADAMRDSQFAFERAMATITKATAGVRRDLPVEIDPSSVVQAKKGWEDGRVALNSFLTTLNTATGLNEMRLIPPSGPDQTKEYGRSQRKYLELTKKTKLCQNRGGPALSQAWGQLMVSGYLQDSCGIPDLEGYFFQ